MLTRTAILITSLAFALPLWAQPDGRDIATAIPITFGQTIDDIMDSSTKPRAVYKVTLARGQRFSATLTIPSSRPGAVVGLYLWDGSVRSLANVVCGTIYSDQLIRRYENSETRALAFDYLVATAGDYFVMPCTRSTGVQYRLQVTAEGVPLGTQLPAQTGCMFGQVESMEYTIRLIALNLPDRVTIGGVEACDSCAVKPPIYEPVARKMEDAMRAGVNVEACYDDRGNIFKVKLQR